MRSDFRFVFSSLPSGLPAVAVGGVGGGADMRAAIRKQNTRTLLSDAWYQAVPRLEHSHRELRESDGFELSVGRFCHETEPPTPLLYPSPAFRASTEGLCACCRAALSYGSRQQATILPLSGVFFGEDNRSKVKGRKEWTGVCV